MRNCKNLNKMSSPANQRRGFTWIQLLHPETQPEIKPEQAAQREPEQKLQPYWSEESCITTCEEYIAYKVVDDSPTFMLPGNLYKVDNLIYSWDSTTQQWICIDSLPLSDDESVEMIEKLRMERDV